MEILLNRLYFTLTRFIETSSSKTIIGFSRSILAAGVILKLVFNDITFIIPLYKLQAVDLHALKYRCNFFLLFSPVHLPEMRLVAIIVLVLIISGYFIKLTSLIHFWISASFFMVRPVSIGVDNIEMLLTLLLVPVCLCDERKNHWHEPLLHDRFNSQIQNIFLLVIKLQVAFIYFDSFYEKLFVQEWLNGTVIYYWFTNNFFGLHPAVIRLVHPVLTSIPVLLLLAWSTLAFEAVLAIAFLFTSRVKLFLLKCGVLFHFSILLIHGFSFLFFAMSAALFLYLFPAEKKFSLFITNE